MICGCVGRSAGRFGHHARPFKSNRVVCAEVLHRSDRITGWHFNTAFLSSQESMLHCLGIFCVSVLHFFFFPLIYTGGAILDPCKINIIKLSVTVCTLTLFVWFHDSHILYCRHFSEPSSSSYCSKYLIRYSGQWLWFVLSLQTFCYMSKSF